MALRTRLFHSHILHGPAYNPLSPPRQIDAYDLSLSSLNPISSTSLGSATPDALQSPPMAPFAFSRMLLCNITHTVHAQRKQVLKSAPGSSSSAMTSPLSYWTRSTKCSTPFAAKSPHTFIAGWRTFPSPLPTLLAHNLHLAPHTSLRTTRRTLPLPHRKAHPHLNHSRNTRT